MKEQAAFLVGPGGEVIGLYTELIPLRCLGKLKTRRASTVEFNELEQRWEVSEPGCGAVLFSHPCRDVCLNWERRILGRSRSLQKLKRESL